MTALALAAPAVDGPAVNGRRVERAARLALLGELACFPKPGLVSFVDAGSHADMDATSFLRSVIGLSGYFHDMAAAGAAGAGFAALNRIGRVAEVAMFRATGGVNTHRGAVFALGLLAAAAGAAGEGAGPDELCALVAERWGAAVLAARGDEQSHGAAVRKRYGAPGAREEAAAGFPTVTRHALPAWRAARRKGADPATAAVQAFFASVAALEDTNLLHRGGVEGLAHARAAAAGFLDAGGVLAPGWHARALAVHRGFVARRLSPGGSADILAATLFLLALAEG
ncbi:triphosphoribosyl-dephospho-CoA synthase MdcB [Azospirillum sp. RWY-5-1]|uniref:Probable 2-(5''-triphosphoribosyl)-3'-dephosphocoenzyme-A synthase n=1 Tax=Azospirillum oleiclasticum TaxID=2735135 RepID=A0ABX2T6M5_9PROT|nr:triphosphoribosyl-dephospho-CoA synthase MdcB [Azospirillum oleiclasticum]NYZ12547.1 triphosphoribosyl-dephospho-CoA synthase MdcB [Azospirillum oleiclasticum]NYZ19707.1 triphosphoribosyl-dephospho-CoA synthase MdcB [Azospirillum oleiclasticum]